MSSGFGCFQEDDDDAQEYIVGEKHAQEGCAGCKTGDSCSGLCTRSSELPERRESCKGAACNLCAKGCEKEEKDDQKRAGLRGKTINPDNSVEGEHGCALEEIGQQKIYQEAGMSKARRGSKRELCIKCKEAAAEAMANQREAVCRSCLHNLLLAKFKSAINKHSLITRHDRVLLAFSGSHSSRVALEFLREIQSAAKTDAEAAAERGRIAFSLGIAFVEERLATGVSAEEAAQKVEEIRKICRANPTGAEPIRLHVASLEDVFCYSEEAAITSAEERRESRDGAINGFLEAQKMEDRVELSAAVNGGGCLIEREGRSVTKEALDASSAPDLEDPERSYGSVGKIRGLHTDIPLERARKLVALLDGIKDQTGKEDLVESLRMEVLQQIAQVHRYTKVVLGTCTSRIAARVIAATTKGRGFALPADIQPYDARWSVPVVLPLRDCVARELALHCHLSRLETVFVRQMGTLQVARKSISALTNEFVNALQVENPSREYTIVRTAAKLQPFAFNCAPIEDGSHQQKSTLRNTSMPLQADSSEKITATPTSIEGLSCDPLELCFICGAPLALRDLPAVNDEGLGGNGESIKVGFSLPTELKNGSPHRNACRSCRFSILAEDIAGSSTRGGRVLELMPPIIRSRGLRSVAERRQRARAEIEEFLLDDGDG